MILETLWDFPEKYGTIAIDPPRPYKGSGPVGTGGRGKEFVRDSPSPSSVALYGSISLREIEDLPIEYLSLPQSHLFLWATNSFMQAALRLPAIWGFDFKTILTWGKVKNDGTASMKTGYYFRGATEHIIFATRGKQKLLGKEALPTLRLSERLPHSVKPDWFFEMCEACSPSDRLEVFSRKSRIGWDSYGNQAQDAEAWKEGMQNHD